METLKEEIEQKNIEQKIKYYDKVLEKQPKNPKAYSLKAKNLKKLERLSEAITCYTEALEIVNGKHLAERAKLYGLTRQVYSSFRGSKSSIAASSRQGR